MTLLPRLALVLVAVAAASVALGTTGTVLVLATVGGLVIADARAARTTLACERELPETLSRGVAAPLTITLAGPHTDRATVRQPLVPDLRIGQREAAGGLETHVVPSRRGRHELPPVAVRVRGPLGLAGWQRQLDGPREVVVYPDLPAARRIALAVREQRFGTLGALRRGPLGLGTTFDRVRDYVPGDELRQVNWRATARIGRPMSNQHRIETDRELQLVLDAGRLMRAPLGDRTRLDAALDAAAAVAMVADELADRCGALAFDDRVRRRIPAAQGSGAALIRGLHDLEPSAQDSDYARAFQAVAGGRRALVMVFTDLLDEAAGRSLLAAAPVLARRHALVIASARDPDLDDIVGRRPAGERDALAMAAATDLLGSRRRLAARLGAAGAAVVEAPPATLGAACVSAYLRAKRSGRL